MNSGLIIHEILSVFLFYTCFCRSLKMSIETEREIRLSFWALSIASVLSIFAPLYGWQPDYVTTALLASISVVQYSTARFWRHSTPQSFQADPAPAVRLTERAKA